MSEKQLNNSYLSLVEKLMKFIVHNGKGVKNLPKDASFVVFSSTNKELNNFSERILESTLKKHPEKPVIKAEEQPKSSEPWKFTAITP